MAISMAIARSLAVALTAPFALRVRRVGHAWDGVGSAVHSGQRQASQRPARSSRRKQPHPATVTSSRPLLL